MTLTDTGRDHSFFAGLDDSRIGKLFSIAKEVTFEENDLILKAGQQSQYFYLVLSGSVCVEVTARLYNVCIQSLGPGEAFGWSSLLDHHDTLFQVRAREKSTALCLDGEDLCAILRNDSELAAELLRRTLKVVAGRVQATEARLGELCGVRMQNLRKECL
jgi:CRP/FNR family cyclic AMP-dependent transcriptional regulator